MSEEVREGERREDRREEMSGQRKKRENKTRTSIWL